MKNICLILTTLLFSQWLYVEFGPCNPVARIALSIHLLVSSSITGMAVLGPVP